MLFFVKGVNDMLLICYPKCSTCQKAKKWLIENEFSFEERNIVKENPTFEELKSWKEKGNVSLKKMINTSGLLYRQMHLKEKLVNMDEDEVLQLISTNGMLVKRPILVSEKTVLFGFKEKEYETLLH